MYFFKRLFILRFGVILVTILVADVYSSCVFRMTCPCGSSGKNYTRCYGNKIENYSCERWANCQTCDINNELCVTCPPGRSGPTCKEGSCPFLKRPKNGSIHCSYDGTGTRSCTGRCFPGFHFESLRRTDKITLNCEQNEWTPLKNIPDCKLTAKECELGLTGSGYYNCTIGMHGSHCDINCSGKPQGRYYCYPGEGWNSTLPNCVYPKEQPRLRVKKEKAICPDPATPKDGGRIDLKGNSIPSPHIFREGDSVLYFCKGRNTPFEQTTYLTCRPDGTWDRNIPQCAPTQKGNMFLEIKVQTQASGGQTSCKHPGVVENGIIQDFESNTEHFPVGTELTFLCIEGYQREGPEAIYCLRNLSWSEAPPVCTRPSTTPLPPAPQLSCKHPGSVENGFIVDDVPDQSLPLGSKLRIQCNKGYELVGADAIYCLQTFNQPPYWSDVPPLCKPVDTTTPAIDEIQCKHPGTDENGMIENNPPETERFPVGTPLKFQCAEGYQLVGPTNLYCKRNGEWSQGPPSCRFIPKILVPAAYCAHPGMVENGRIEGVSSRSSFPAGAVLKIHCMAETRLEGSMTIVCKHNGQWSHPLPTCKRFSQETIAEEAIAPQLSCRHPGTIENGVSEHRVSKVQIYVEGDEIKFECMEGYTMEGPDTLRCLNTGKWTSSPPTCRSPKKIPDCGQTFQDVYKHTGKYSRSDWPWTVAISTVGEDDIEKVFCGGALLNSRTVLTAAHCATSSRNINLHFGHRMQSRTGVPVPEQIRTIQISGVIIHPEYDDETHANDIALMKFEPHVHYDRRTRTVCLPAPTLSSSGENLFPGTSAIVTGYGLHFAANHSSTAKFTMLEFPVQNERQCEEICRGQGLVSCNPSTFCAGYPKDANECVYGGSPLVIFHPDKKRYTLEGLVTRSDSARNRWNGRCKRPESFTTFTNVTHFMPFIMKHLNSNNQ